MFHKLSNTHVTTTNSDHQFTIDDLSKNLSCAKHVVTIAEPLDLDWAAMQIDPFTQQSIYLVTLGSLIFDAT